MLFVHTVIHFFILQYQYLYIIAFRICFSVHGRELKSFVPLNSRSWVSRLQLFSSKPRSWVARFTPLCAKPRSWVGRRNCFLQNHGRALLILLYFVQNHGRGLLAADNFEEISSPNYPRRLQR